MGIRLSKSIPINTLRLDDYDEVHSRRFNDPVSYRLLKNRLTGTELEEYILSFADHNEYQDYYDSYYWRLSQDHVVRTLHFVDCSKSEFCATSYSAKVYIERIPIKLSDIKDIPYPDNLYVLLAALDGFDRIVQKAGFFEIQEYMICVNRQGEIKVWINDNLSRNYPDSMRSRRVANQEEMVRRLIGIIDENTDAQSQPRPLPEYIYSHVDNPSFGDAMLLVREYAREYKVDIPNNFECILEVLNDSKYPSEPYTQRSVTHSHLSKSYMRSSMNLLPREQGVPQRVTASFGTTLIPPKIQPHINAGLSPLSRVGQINTQSRMRRVEHVNFGGRSPLVEQRVRHVSRSLAPFQAAPMHQLLGQSRMPMMISPKSNITIPSVRNLASQSKISSRPLQYYQQNKNSSILKNGNSVNRPFYPKNEPQIARRLPTPINAQKMVEVQRGVPLKRRTVTESEVYQSSHNIHNPGSSKSSMIVEHYQNSPQQREEKVRQVQDTHYEPIQIKIPQNIQTLKEHSNEFVNPFFEEESHEVVPYYEEIPLQIPKREKVQLHLRTAEDQRSEQQLEEIKRNKTQLLKEAKQVINRIARESQPHEYSYNTEPTQYPYNQQSGHNYNSQHSEYRQEEKKLTQLENSQRYNITVEQTDSKVEPKRSNTFQQSPTVTDVKSLVYHSPGDFHEIDPEIARDLLALGD